MDKIGVSTRAAAALWAMQHAVVSQCSQPFDPSIRTMTGSDSFTHFWGCLTYLPSGTRPAQLVGEVPALAEQAVTR